MVVYLYLIERYQSRSMVRTQILLDKYEIEDPEHFKIDILANRGLSPTVGNKWQATQWTIPV